MNGFAHCTAEIACRDTESVPCRQANPPIPIPICQSADPSRTSPPDRHQSATAAWAGARARCPCAGCHRTGCARESCCARAVAPGRAAGTRRVARPRLHAASRAFAVRNSSTATCARLLLRATCSLASALGRPAHRSIALSPVHNGQRLARPSRVFRQGGQGGRAEGRRA